MVFNCRILGAMVLCCIHNHGPDKRKVSTKSIDVGFGARTVVIGHSARAPGETKPGDDDDRVGGELTVRQHRYELRRGMCQPAIARRARSELRRRAR